MPPPRPATRSIAIRLDLPGSGLTETRAIRFVKSLEWTGGNWWSDAVVAVRHADGADAVIFDRGIILPPDVPEVAIVSGPPTLVAQRFRGQAPVIVGWADRPERGFVGDVRVTASERTRGGDMYSECVQQWSWLHDGGPTPVSYDEAYRQLREAVRRSPQRPVA